MTAPAAEQRTVRVSVFRRKEGDDPAEQRYDTFDVAVGPRATILDALVAIRRQQDATLTFRHSCFHASCGTCGMRVNGREGLACVTPVPDGDEVVVEPLANIPIVSDLVVDMDVFYEDFDEAGPPARARRRPHARVRAGRGDRPARALRGLHRVRDLPVRLPGGRQRPALRRAGRPRGGLATRRRAAGPRSRSRSSSSWTTSRRRGAATWPGSAPRRARRASTRPARSCGSAGRRRPRGCDASSPSEGPADGQHDRGAPPARRLFSFGGTR